MRIRQEILPRVGLQGKGQTLQRIWLASVMKATLLSWLTIILVFGLVISSCDLAQAQSAQDLINAERSLHNINQRSSSGSNTNYQPTSDSKDHASDATDAGYAAYKRYWSSGSQADFNAAYQQFQNAFVDIPYYGPAELGLCHLYERSGDYEKAIAACQIATRSHRFARGKAVKKWLENEMIPSLTVDLHQKEYEIAVKEYDRKCGSGSLTDQLNNGITAVESERGLPVDLNTSIARTVTDCAKTTADMLVRAKGLNEEIATWNKRHKEE